MDTHAYCIAPINRGICGKKIPCKTHINQDKYLDHDDDICVFPRRGVGAPGVCGVSNCNKHPVIPRNSKKNDQLDNVDASFDIKQEPKESKKRERSESFSKILNKASVPKKRRAIIAAPISISSSDISSESDSSSESSIERMLKKYKKNKKYEKTKSNKNLPINTVSEDKFHKLLDLYDRIESDKLELIKTELRHSKDILKLIRKNNNFSSSEDSD